MQTIIIGAVIVTIIAYIVFTIKRKKLSKAIKLIRSGEKDTVIMKQTLEQIKHIVDAHFDNAIFTGQTLLFNDGQNMYIIVPINEKETLLSLVPDMDKVEEYAEIEKNILSSEKQINTKTIIPIIGSAYIHEEKVMVKTHQFKGVPNKWVHMNDFPDHNDAKKFAQMVTEKGLINTQHWIDYNLTIYSKN